MKHQHTPKKTYVKPEIFEDFTSLSVAHADYFGYGFMACAKNSWCNPDSCQGEVS